MLFEMYLEYLLYSKKKRREVVRLLNLLVEETCEDKIKEYRAQIEMVNVNLKWKDYKAYYGKDTCQ